MKKLKLTLNKTMVARLQNKQQTKIIGGEQPTTWLDSCLKDTEYPRCAWSGCWGAASCDSMGYPHDDTCMTEMTNKCHNDD
ncbi:MAG: class I lanthipeptide [Bacteroidales bacterium]|nr:class I lanthipeptide [Bacteroidales bacterium]